MMNSLEVKLKKHGLVEQFNCQVRDFFNRGVLSWVSDIPELEEMQKFFISLTYTLKSFLLTTTKLRVCGNSSFSVNKNNPSLFQCMIDGPAYLQSLEGIILRWRCGQEEAHADIKNCQHKVASNKKDISLRRVLLRPDGMG